MSQKTNMQCLIRPYRPTDKSAVISLLRLGILEHIYPAFFKAMMHTDHIGVTLSISVAGYVLGGSSYLQALLFGGAWISLIYFCCYDFYDTYLKRRLDVEMSDIQANFLDSPASNFWVAETEVNGTSNVAGLLAVVGVQDGVSCNRNDGCEQAGSLGGIFQLIVSSPQRRKGLGIWLVETAVEFCKEQGFSRVVVEISSPQTAALSLFRKLGFTVTNNNTPSNPWVSKLARINIIRMEKYL
ncbi:N-acetyltransferase 8 [Misgurnus anguillicaudatus]|uniref:N-acetyltransferase 8 n=1 Tax=Misgurnus anguillicaudatus TaxID=75329 RepID=UPI003CCFABBA